MCSDTVAAPMDYPLCASEQGAKNSTDCNGDGWKGNNANNFMSYPGGPYCGQRFTPQQMARVRCWTQAVYRGWFEKH